MFIEIKQQMRFAIFFIIKGLWPLIMPAPPCAGLVLVIYRRERINLIGLLSFGSITAKNQATQSAPKGSVQKSRKQWQWPAAAAFLNRRQSPLPAASRQIWQLADFKHRIRELTGRSWYVSWAYRYSQLRRYISGWINYFGLSEYYRPVPELDHWLRRRMRMCYLQQ